MLIPQVDNKPLLLNGKYKETQRCHHLIDTPSVDVDVQEEDSAYGNLNNNALTYRPIWTASCPESPVVVHFVFQILSILQWRSTYQFKCKITSVLLSLDILKCKKKNLFAKMSVFHLFPVCLKLYKMKYRQKNSYITFNLFLYIKKKIYDFRFVHMWKYSLLITFNTCYTMVDLFLPHNCYPCGFIWEQVSYRMFWTVFTVRF